MAKYKRKNNNDNRKKKKTEVTHQCFMKIYYLENQKDNIIVSVKSISLKMTKGKVRQKSEMELSVIRFCKVFVDCTAMRLVLMES